MLRTRYNEMTGAQHVLLGTVTTGASLLVSYAFGKRYTFPLLAKSVADELEQRRDKGADERELSEHDKNVLAQALADYADGVRRNCEDEGEAARLNESIDRLTATLL